MLSPVIPAKAGIQSLRKMLCGKHIRGIVRRVLGPRFRGDERDDASRAGRSGQAASGGGLSPNTAAILLCRVCALNGLTM
jgi:hypothetical protein